MPRYTSISECLNTLVFTRFGADLGCILGLKAKSYLPISASLVVFDFQALVYFYQ